MCILDLDLDNKKPDAITATISCMHALHN